MSAVQEWRERYRAADLDAIPLRPKSKRPLCRGWQELAPEEQWRRSRDYDRLNIGVRPGRGRAVIDADTAEAADLVDRRLQDMGLVTPKVATPHGGAHFYLQLDVPVEFEYQKLDAAIGPGEFRTGPGAQVAAPPSVVDGRQYTFVRGWPEDVPRLQPVAFADCLWLVPGKATRLPRQTVLELEETPLVRWPMIPREITALLAALKTAKVGAPIWGFASTSEAEWHAVLILIGTGRQLGDITKLFDFWQPVHYAAKPQAGRRAYLQLTYQKAREAWYAKAERRELAAYYEDVLAWTWTGRTGATDRAVYLAALRLAWQFGRLDVALSARDVSVWAGVDRHTASAALKRLAHLLTPVVASKGRKAATYHLQLPTRLARSGDVLQPSSVGDYPELWARGRLGKTSGAVYAVLTDRPQKSADLAALTGQSHRATKRALARLAGAGLALRTVEGTEGWIRGWRDLVDVAADYDAAGAAHARRQRYSRERAAYYSQPQDGEV